MKADTKENKRKKQSSTQKTGRKRSAPQKRERKTGEERKGLRYLGGLLLAKMARGGAERLRDKAEEVNQLNVFPVPDGDTGDNMSMTIESGVDAIENLESDDISDVMDTLSHGMLMGARGNSGVILSQFFAGVAHGLKNCPNANPKALGVALQEGVKMAYTTVMTPTEGTILTVARESVEYAVSMLNSDSTISSFFKDLVSEMHRSLEHTPELLPALKEAGVVDSGGAGLLYIMEGFNRVLNGENSTRVKRKTAEKKPATNISSFGPDSEMEYGYCTEALVQLMRNKCDIDKYDIDELRAYLANIGDSVVAFKTDSIVKLHVHTRTPNLVMSKMLEVGEFITVKVENMSLQHTELEGGNSDSDNDVFSDAPNNNHENSESAAENNNSPTAERARYGIVAVSNGEGISEVFKDLGVNEIVWGGQTNNPSAADFISAYEKINAEHIFVFPNNSNIILTAEMSKDMYEASQIHVIPSKNIGMGYAALSTLALYEDDPEKIVDEAIHTMGMVATGYISPAIRDAEMQGLTISKGDTIGIIDKEIVVSDENAVEACLGLLEILLKDKYLLTVLLGKGVELDDIEALKQALSSDYPDREVYFIEAGQEIYPFVFLAE